MIDGATYFTNAYKEKIFYKKHHLRKLSLEGGITDACID